MRTQVAQHPADAVVPVFLSTAHQVERDLAERLQQFAIRVSALLGKRIHEAIPAAYLVAFRSIMMRAGKQSGHLGAKLTGLRREQATMDCFELEADIQQPHLLLTIKVALGCVLLEIDDQMGIQERFVASAVAGERLAHPVAVVLPGVSRQHRGLPLNRRAKR